MSGVPGKPTAPMAEPPNSLGITSAILSSVGLFGWMFMYALMIPYSGDVLDIVKFGWNLMFVTIGSGVSGTLSFVGLLLGALSAGSHRDAVSYFGVILGVIGLLLGAGFLVWRYTTVLG